MFQSLSSKKKKSLLYAIARLTLSLLHVSLVTDRLSSFPCVKTYPKKCNCFVELLLMILFYFLSCFWFFTTDIVFRRFQVGETSYSMRKVPR